MTSEYKEIEYAFPVPPGCGGAKGMTLRDYFAAKAMQATISGAMADGTHFGPNDHPSFAFFAYKMADAMLEARK
jgi:hypothetical protein